MLLFKYLLVSGLLAHLAAITIFLHFRSTGATPHRYVLKGVEFLDRDSSPTRHIARAARLVLLDSGLVSDPLDRYPPDVTTELPQWKGIGASALRRDTGPRYTHQGIPIATTDHNMWTLSVAPPVHSVYVDSVEKLESALGSASPGQEIVLKPGRYRLSGDLLLRPDGTMHEPLILRGEHLSDTVVELEDTARVVVAGKFWTVSDLIVRGQCTHGPCPYLFEADSIAGGFTVRNLFVSGIQSLVKTSRETTSTTAGLIDGVTLVGGNFPTVTSRWRQRAVREIRIPDGPDKFLIMCTQKVDEPDCDTDSLSEAVKKAADGGLLLLRAGTYEQAATLRKSNLHILAEPGAALRRTSVQGKGALVVDADTTIEGLECSHVKVSDGNGCCVRQQNGDVTLIGVHFHHAQMGILTGHKGGKITILDSYLHDSGYDESGQLGHNIYVNSGKLEFIRSWSLAARNAGHELKSRAEHTKIEDSLLASLNARDSRLIDVPVGGLLEVSGSVLGEGPRSENSDMIGYGLEIKGGKLKHRRNSVAVRRNTMYVDRPQGAKLLSENYAESIDFSENIVIGDTTAPPSNTHFRDREDAGVSDYPALKTLNF